MFSQPRRINQCTKENPSSSGIYPYTIVSQFDHPISRLCRLAWRGSVNVPDFVVNVALLSATFFKI